MKKIVLSIVLACFGFCFFVGCASSGASKISKNLTTHDIIVSLDVKENVLHLEQKISYINTSNNVLRSIKMNVFGNVYKQNSENPPVSKIIEKDAYPNGKNFGGVQIDNFEISGISMPYEMFSSDTVLVAKLENDLYPQEKVEIKANYKVKLAQIRHRLGYADDIYSLAHFYLAPCALKDDGTFLNYNYTTYGDPFFFECANFDVKLTLPEKFKFASSGKVLDVKTENSKSTYKIKAIASRDFAILASAQFDSISKKINGTEITYLYKKNQVQGSQQVPASTNASNTEENNLGTVEIEEILNLSVEAHAFFTKTFGDLKLDRLFVVEAPLTFGGMEYSNIATVSLEARKQIESYKEIVVHEIAHQWWFGAVGNNQVEQGWLDEGLTDFSTSLFFNQKKEDLRVHYAKILEKQNVFFEVDKNIYGSADLSIDRPLNKFRTDTEYAILAYNQASFMFFNLYEIVGEKNFVKACKHYFQKYQYKIATGNDLVAVFSKSTRTDLEKFFSNWLSGNINLLEL